LTNLSVTALDFSFSVKVTQKNSTQRILKVKLLVFTGTNMRGDGILNGSRYWYAARKWNHKKH